MAHAEMAQYRAPFPKAGEDRRPTLDWPRQSPIAGEPENIVEIVETYADWMARSNVPKLIVDAKPGSILVGAALFVSD